MNLGSRSNEVFKNLSGLHVERLYIEGGLSGILEFNGFQASNLKAFSMCNTQVHDFEFDLFNVQTVEWLDISGNRLGWVTSPNLSNLYYLDISRQTPIEQCTTLFWYGWKLDARTLYGNLTFLDLSGMILCYKEKDFPISCYSHVKYVNLRNTGLTVLAGPDDGCQKNRKLAINYIDMEDDNLECVNMTFLAQYDWSALNVIKLSNNRLGFSDSDACKDIQTAQVMDFLQPFWNLTELYLDKNFMKDNLPPDMLKNQTRLQSLHLSDMALTNVTLTIRHLLNLKFLDFSYNKIPCLYNSTLRDINTIIGYTPIQRNVSKTLELNLVYNPLSCSCACLEFYQWMRNVRPYVTFTDLESYQCTFDNKHKVSMSDLNFIVTTLNSQCLKPDWSLVIRLSAAVTIIYITITVVTTLYRFRHTLRYIWLKYKMHRLYLERHILDPKYHFDAFVSCERTDAIWVKRNFLPKLENKQTGLKFCVAQRDFLVGATIVDNIVRSINQSKKVVNIISQKFLKSGWCKEELLIGHQESLSRGKNILVCIFMPDIIQNQLPDRFRFILNHVTCIKWPRDPTAQHVFWIMLQRALLDGEQQNAAKGQDLVGRNPLIERAPRETTEV